jgi:hypothetical protein
MNDLDWIVGHRFQEAVRYEFTWSFNFDNKVAVTSECLWRLIENGRILCTSLDHGQKSGLPAAIDAAAEVNKVLSGEAASVVHLREGTLDLEIHFGPRRAIQLLPSSALYEGWQVGGPPGLFIAVGGGDLTIFKPPVGL